MSLDIIEIEIYKALEQMAEKASFTEFVLAKKIRDNAKITGKPKAGIALDNLENAVEALAEEKGIFYSLHLSSANVLMIRKEAEASSLLAQEARHRRTGSERSMQVFTRGDLNGKGTAQKQKKRTERKSIRLTEDFDEE